MEIRLLESSKLVNSLFNKKKSDKAKLILAMLMSGAHVRKVTSGGPSPTLNKNIAMGYVKSGYHKSGTLLKVKVRNKLQDAKIVKMLFVPSRYYK
ncbi:25544_t:CDS:2 [Gigaspora rosea]|nr:25544_t:CDS:2 [Gigaspora rosea]